MQSTCTIIGLFLTGLCLTGALTGCTSPGRAPAVKSGGGAGSLSTQKKIPATQRPYQINGIWYRPLAHAHGYHKKGLASWYGKDFHGKKTSNGETYNMYGVSAAHKVLPMGTDVEVRNIENGRSIRLTINDRGPFVAGRIIDLSYGAAKKLDIVGPGTSKVEVIAIGTAAPPNANDLNTMPPEDLDRGNFSIQVGAFGNRENALKLASALNQTYSNAQVVPSYSSRNQQTLYRVVVGKCDSLKTAETYENALKSRGFPDAFTIAE